MKTTPKKVVPKRYKNLITEITKCKPRSIVEIGVFKGLHARKMIECAQKFNKNIHYYGFDLFEYYTEEVKLVEGYKTGIPILKDVNNFLKKTKANIQLFKGFTKNTLPEFILQTEEYPVYDFIFIDGGHSLETIAFDWFWCRKIIHRNTVVIFDDYFEDRLDFGCKHLIDNIGPGYKVEILPPQDVFPDKKINFAKVTLV